MRVPFQSRPPLSRRFCLLLLPVFLVLLWPAMRTAAAAPSKPEIEVGKPFPTVWLPRLADGSPASLQQWRGQKVILHVFASW